MGDEGVLQTIHLGSCGASWALAPDASGASGRAGHASARKVLPEAESGAHSRALGTCLVCVIANSAG